METNLHEIWTIVIKEITIMETDYSSTKAGVHNNAKIPQISDWDFSAIAPLDYLENKSTGLNINMGKTEILVGKSNDSGSFRKNGQ